MFNYKRLRYKSKADLCTYDEFQKCISDLIIDESVRSMKNFIQHSSVTCLDHSVNVAFHSFRVCFILGLDYKSAARGGLLHDFFLYDWHKTKPEKGLHGFTHPFAALENANRLFVLNKLEKDIICKHMWPLTLKFPRYRESFVVTLIDKYCTLIEIVKRGTNCNK